MENSTGERKELLRNSLSNHRRLKPAQAAFGQLGPRSNLWVESIKDLGEHQLSQPALTNINSILQQHKELANSMSPRGAETVSTNQTQKQSQLEKAPRPKLARPQSGRNKLKKDNIHNSAALISSPDKKKGSILNLPSESPNVFSRLTSGVSGLNGTQSKIKTQKKADWIEAYGDLEGDLSSAAQFQNKFRRSIVDLHSGNISGSNQSNNSREAFKNVSNFKDGLKSDKVVS